MVEVVKVIVKHCSHRQTVRDQGSAGAPAVARIREYPSGSGRTGHEAHVDSDLWMLALPVTRRWPGLAVAVPQRDTVLPTLPAPYLTADRPRAAPPQFRPRPGSGPPAAAAAERSDA